MLQRSLTASSTSRTALAIALAATLDRQRRARTKLRTPHPGPTAVKNVVLVHGAFADGSGWRGVHDELTRRGYRVTIVQNPLTSLADDVAATSGCSTARTARRSSSAIPGAARSSPKRACTRRSPAWSTSRRSGARCRRNDGAAVRGLRGDARVRHRNAHGRFRLPDRDKFKAGFAARRNRRGRRVPARLAGADQHVGVRDEAQARGVAQQAELGCDRDRRQGVRPGDAAAHGQSASARRSRRSRPAMRLFMTQPKVVADDDRRRRARKLASAKQD